MGAAESRFESMKAGRDRLKKANRDRKVKSSGSTTIIQAAENLEMLRERELYVDPSKNRTENLERPEELTEEELLGRPVGCSEYVYAADEYTAFVRLPKLSKQVMQSVQEEAEKAEALKAAYDIRMNRNPNIFERLILDSYWTHLTCYSFYRRLWLR